ncbi:MAG: SIR2 family protein [Pirellulales bacterium]
MTTADDTKSGADESSLLGEPDILQPFHTQKVAESVDNLIGFLSQNRQAFLLGAGCSKCAGLPLMEELTTDVQKAIPKDDSASSILKALVNDFKSADSCTIEDYMSDLVDWISIAERREFRSGAESQVTIGKTNDGYTATDLRSALTTIKCAIEGAILNRSVHIGYHREFIRTVHGRLQSGKAGHLPPVDYFTLNYDTLLEDALSLERVPLADGFNGGATGWWHADAYEDRAVQARVFKIHGSIDWCLLDSDVLPRRVRHSLKGDDYREPVLIWPASTKYREAQRDPYAQIMDILRRTLHPAHNSETILTIAGYSFGDAHINHELDRALHDSSGRLTAVIFTSDDEPTGLLKQWLNNPRINQHVRVYANRGVFHGDDHVASAADLPWWQFEVLIRLLRGDR